LSKDLRTEYETFGNRTEKIKSLVKKKASVFNEAQVVDAAFKLGILTDDPELADSKEGVEYMNYLSWSTLDREKITEFRDKVIDKMTDYTKEMLDIKFSSKQQKPEKESDKSSFELPVTAKTDIGVKEIERAIAISSGLEVDLDEGVSVEQRKELVGKNPDLYTTTGFLKPDLKFNRVDLPTEFSKSDISNLGITSNSEKQWNNIEGVHFTDFTEVTLESGRKVQNYAFRLHGTVLDRKAKLSEGTTNIVLGEGLQIKAGTEEVRYDTMEDMSKIIDNKQLGRVFKTLIKGNEEMKANFEIARKRAESEGLDTSKPEILNYVIGNTLKEFYINR
jgi:hypothetical protein